MPQTATFSKNFSILGFPFVENDSVSADEGASANPDVGPAWGGTLTTRTDNDTGTLTMDDAGHTITTGDKLDLYFSGGTRRRMTVGTVAGTSVPIDVGAGDNLPALNSAVVAMVPVQRDVIAVVADIMAVGVQCDYESQLHFMEVDGTTEDLTVHLVPENNGQPQSYEWHSGAGSTPFTGTLVSKVWFSHADTAATHNMVAAILKN